MPILISVFRSRFDTFLRRTSLVLAGAGACVMALMLCIVCVNIGLRPLGGSIRGTVEISGYLCAMAVGLCMPAAQLAKSHICAGLWASRLPRRVRLAQQGLCSLACALLLGWTALEILEIGAYARETGEYIDGFGFSYYPMAVGLGAGMLLHGTLCLRDVLAALLATETER